MDIQEETNPYRKGKRIRNTHDTIRPFQSEDGSLTFDTKKSTEIEGNGEYATNTETPSFILPSGQRVSKAEEVTCYCCKYNFKNPKNGCGPLTEASVILCARCNRPFCHAHTWMPPFASSRYCTGCLLIRSAEIAAICAGITITFIIRIITWPFRAITKRRK